MLERRTVTDYVAAAGLCLLVIAAVDGAIELFEYVTSINLWATCGTIGLLLLVVINVFVAVFEQDSPLRRGFRRLAMWKRLRLRKRVTSHGDLSLGDDAGLAAMR
jgi:hypothetical protein